ncbi:MAG: DUF4912 domain-containing protein [Treponema sp.]|jgi:hypothetical protein|nr:DUF4912 domain-containing protein [Treponema sp.]
MEESPHSPVSRIWLDSLSTDELIKYADSYGVDIPAELERIFIIEEILEAASIDIQEPEDLIEVNPSYSEPALLPKQYNISYIEVIVRDPLWVFAFWEIKLHDREIHENAKNFGGYFLRVIPLDKEGNERESNENTFTVSVSTEDCARYLGFAGYSNNETETNPKNGDLKNLNCYVIKLGVVRGSSELLIASSSPFTLPTLSENDNIADLSRNPLLRLSGVQDLSVIKSKDRHIRAKR